MVLTSDGRSFWDGSVYNEKFFSSGKTFDVSVSTVHLLMLLWPKSVNVKLYILTVKLS